MDSSLLLGFIAASLVVLLIPGPGVLYVVARSLGQGYRAGLISVLGLSVGALAHVAAAAMGLSAILLTSAVAFEIVRALGAAYLIYLGLRLLLDRRRSAGLPHTARQSDRRIFSEGVLVSLFNPKIALFFLAYLPQFVDPAAGAVTLQILLLGLLYVGLALLTDGGYALLAGKVRRWIGRSVMGDVVPRYLCGLVYIGLGVNAALTGRKG